MYTKLLQLCLTVCDPTICILPGSLECPQWDRAPGSYLWCYLDSASLDLLAPPLLSAFPDHWEGGLRVGAEPFPEHNKLSGSRHASQILVLKQQAKMIIIYS